MATMRYAAQAFLDGFTSMASIFSPAVRPGSEEPLFLSDSAPDAIGSVDQTIMVDVEHFLREIEPLILGDRLIHGEAQVLLQEIQTSRSILSIPQSSA